jgi:hypothetical protein
MRSFCEQLQQRLLEDMSGSLTEQELLHIQSCQQCREAHENVLTVGPDLVKIAAQSRAAMPSHLRPEWKAQILAQIQAALTETAPGRHAQELRVPVGSLRKPTMLVRAGHRSGFLRWAMAAAVLVMLVGAGYFLLPGYRTVGKVEFADGAVRVKTVSQVRQSEGIGRMGFQRSATIQVPQDSKGLFSFGNNIRCALTGSTEMAVNREDQVALLHGTAWFRVLPEGKSFEVVSPHGTVRVLGTSFGVAVSDDETRVEVIEGTVWIGRANEESTITAGQLVRITQDGLTSPSARAEKTDVPHWVTALLAKEKTAQAGRFVPSVAIE